MSKYAKLVFLLVVSALLVTISFTGSVEAKKVTLRFAGVASADHFVAKGMEVFKRKAFEASGGDIIVKTFPAMALGGERDMAESAVFGELDLLYLSEGMTGNFVPGFKIFALPFLIKGPDHLNAFMVAPLGRILTESCSEKGLKLLWCKYLANRNPINSVRPITKVADYKGLKIRTQENPVQMDTMKALGAMPTALPLPEAYPAFQTGVAQGSFADVGAMVVFNWAEVLKYITLAPLFPSLVDLFMSQKVWNGLSLEHKASVLEGAKALGEYFDREAPTAEQYYIDILKKKGYNEFNTLDRARYPEFVRALQPVYDKFLKQNPALKPYVDWLSAH